MGAGGRDPVIVPSWFHSDGCTLFPNVWRGINLRPCCVEHDWLYATGHTFTDWFNANTGLATCMWQKGAPDAAIVALLGVSTVGILFFVLGAKVVKAVRR